MAPQRIICSYCLWVFWGVFFFYCLFSPFFGAQSCFICYDVVVWEMAFVSFLLCNDETGMETTPLGNGVTPRYELWHPLQLERSVALRPLFQRTLKSHTESPRSLSDLKRFLKSSRIISVFGFPRSDFAPAPHTTCCYWHVGRWSWGSIHREAFSRKVCQVK